jgi:hypothetical protein
MGLSVPNNFPRICLSAKPGDQDWDGSLASTRMVCQIFLFDLMLTPPSNGRGLGPGVLS